MSGRYDDILHLPHPESQNHPHMSMNDRAAQFLPFAALTGYDAAILEAARLTDEKKTISGESRERINDRLAALSHTTGFQATVCVTYFVPDQKKSGGHYETTEDEVRKVDDFSKKLILKNGKAIAFDDIFSIESSLFDEDVFL